jgi:hypothetical protein
MSIATALQELYRERDRLDAERARLDDAIAALEGLGGLPPTASPKRSKPDGRSAPKPPVVCPFCGETAKGMAGLAAHVRGSHPDRYPDQYNEWKASRA